MDAKIAKGHWFFIFNNVPDLPEILIQGKEEIWLRFIFSQWCYNPHILTDEDINVYLKAYQQPGALRGAFSGYRAGGEDVEQDKADRDHIIECRTLGLWGEDFELGGKMWDFREAWHKVAKILNSSPFLNVVICLMKRNLNL